MPRSDSVRPLVVNAECAARMLGVSRPSFYRLLAAGEFSVPRIKLTERRVGFRVADIEAWIDTREAA